MLNFLSRELIEFGEINHNFDYAPNLPVIKNNEIKFLAEKILLPKTGAVIERPRLYSHLENSLTQFSSTLVTGRVGTGKTVLALDFAKKKNYDVAWYNIETTDNDWKIFFGYLEQSLRQFQIASKYKESPNEIEDCSVTESLAALFSAIEVKKKLLIVLDDLHSVYDAEWFNEFFGALLSLPTPNVRLLLLARTLPPFPIWRLRSKHFLDVVDEKLLAFTLTETIELFSRYKLSENVARAAYKRAYGKISKLREIAEKKAVN